MKRKLLLIVSLVVSLPAGAVEPGPNEVKEEERVLVDENRWGSDPEEYEPSNCDLWHSIKTALTILLHGSG